MASAAGGSGGGQDNRRSSLGKGKKQVDPFDKPTKRWLAEQHRYLEATHEQFVAAGEEPPFDIESMRRRYSSLVTPPNPAATTTPSSSMPGEKKSSCPF